MAAGRPAMPALPLSAAPLQCKATTCKDNVFRPSVALQVTDLGGKSLERPDFATSWQSLRLKAESTARQSVIFWRGRSS